MIDLRSDTVTLPTETMRQAMAQAEVGDDVYGEDPTINRLEALGAQMMGKEAGLFVVSGTMGNLVAILAHTHAGDEIIVGANSHTYYCETGGLAMLAGVMPRLIDDESGIIEPAAVKAALRPKDIHFPQTRLVCLENTHARGGGVITTPAQMRDIYELAQENNLKVHLDGARIFNAAVATGIAAKEFARYADSVMFCLAKGLSAPVGSLLTGSKEFIERARIARKLVGGGMRQAGVLAAAGIIALESMIERLAEDHANARYLAEGLATLKGISLQLERVQTNIVIFNLIKPGLEAGKFLASLKQKGILANSMSPTSVRMVTHRHIGRAEIDLTLAAVEEILAE
ncbi:MAG: low-specificity L-threonine aldolase [Clostridia bacterium]|nr:low-specificity L-threonine aldolase [Clostridia bacterium]